MKIAFLIYFGITLLSCNKMIDDSYNSINILNYSPTQCAEKWQFGSTDAETIANFDQYLKEIGIEAKSISISATDGKVYCAACTCPSGRVISLKADVINSEKLVNLGFVKI